MYIHVITEQQNLYALILAKKTPRPDCYRNSRRSSKQAVA